MVNLKYSVLLLVLMCTNLTAQEEAVEDAGKSFDAFVSGTVYSQGKLVTAGLPIIVKADLLWGQRDSDQLKILEEQAGKLPVFTANGEGLTDVKGNFILKISVKSTNNIKFPKSASRVDNTILVLPYAFISVEVRTNQNTISDILNVRVQLGQESIVPKIKISRVPKVTGLVVDMFKRTPLAGVSLKLQGHRVIDNRREKVSISTITDDKGRFVFEGKDVPLGRCVVHSIDRNWAIDLEASIRRGLNLSPGDEHDAGFVPMVKAGSVRFTLDVDLKTGEAPYVYIQVTPGGKEQFGMEGEMNDNHTEIHGLPPAKYGLTITRIPGCFPMFYTVDIVAGESVDLGNIKKTKMERIEIQVNMDGKPVKLFNAKATLTNSEEPSELIRKNSIDADQWRRMQRFGNTGYNMSFEDPFLKSLFKGRWTIEIRTKSAAPSYFEVEIPHSKPIVVELKIGGTAFLSIEGQRGQAPFHYFQVDSPDHIANKGAIGAQRFENLRVTGNISGNGKSDYNGRCHLPNIPEGEYLFCYQAKGAWMTDTVVIVAGETLNRTLEPKKFKVDVTCYMDSKPFVGKQMVIIPAPTDRTGVQLYSRKNLDSNGVANFEEVDPGPYLALTGREWDWISNNRSLDKKTAALRIGRGLFVQSDCEINIELQDELRNWVSISLNEVKDEWGHVKTRGTLMLISDDPTMPAPIAINQQTNGSKPVDFGPLPLGKYSIVLQWNHNQPVAQETIENTSTVENYKITWNWHKLTLNLPKLGKRRSGFYSVRNIIDDKGTYGVISIRSEVRSAKIEINELLAGNYEVSYYDQGDRSCEFIDFQSNLEFTIKPFDTTGSIEIVPNYQNDSSILSDLSGGFTKISFFKTASKASMPDFMVMETLNMTKTLSAIPVGEYRVLIEKGLYSKVYEDVKIEKGKSTSIILKYKIVGFCMTVGVWNAPTIVGLKVGIVYYDKSGNIVKASPVFGGGERLGHLRNSSNMISLAAIPEKVILIEYSIQGYKPVRAKVVRNRRGRIDMIPEDN